jgi:hypothetical protein
LPETIEGRHPNAFADFLQSLIFGKFPYRRARLVNSMDMASRYQGNALSSPQMDLCLWQLDEKPAFTKNA